METRSYFKRRMKELPARTPIVLRSAGWETLAPGFDSPKKASSIVIVTQGLEGRLLIDIEDRTVSLEAFEACVLMPGERRRLYTKEAGSVHQSFSFFGPAAISAVTGFALPLGQSFRLPTSLSGWIHRMKTLLMMSGTAAEREGSVAVFQTLGFIADNLERDAWNVQSSKARQMVTEILLAMNEALDDPNIGVAQIAERMGVDPTTLRRNFRAIQNMCPKTYLDAARARAIAETLERTRSVNETARKMGFRSPDYLSKFFKRQTGMSPGEFIRRGDRL